MATRRFILIDHSIRGFGGHHYEYAVHVLSAARDAGFETILGVNRAFKSDGGVDASWRIVPAYEHGFWRNIAPPAKRRDNSSDWQRRFFEWKLYFKHGKHGQLLAMLPLFRRYYTPATIADDAKNRVQLLFMLLGLILIKWPYNVLASTVYLLRVIVDPLEGYFARLGKALWHLLMMIFYPVRIFKHLWVFKRAAKGPAPAVEFARDTAALFEQVGYREGDVVFVPTLSDHDLGCLQRFLSAHPQAHRATWHLLFRRDLFDTDARKSAASVPANTPAVRAFHRFHQHINGTDVRFYTDTDRLTDEYNTLGISRFHTLPIPINPQFTKRAFHEGVRRPLKIVYAGDARIEKGYHLLPEIVHDLHHNGHADDVVFRIQSNFAHARPEDATIERLARTELQLYPTRRVEVILAPLDSSEYLELVASADILLVLYDAENYFARSSGVLVEALAGGIPVVAPADSWMGQQLADGTYAYLLDRLKQSRITARHRAGDRDFPEKPVSAHADGVNTALAIVKPWDATGLFVLVNAPAEGQPQVILECEQRRAGTIRMKQSRMLPRVAGQDRCICLFELDAASDELHLRLTDGNSGTELKLRGLEIAFVTEAPGKLMTDAVGRAYLPGEPIADHLRWLVDHYDHYRATARAYATRWNDRHSAARLVKELVS